MELLTYTDIYRIVGDNTSVSNEYITKSAAIQIADDNGYNVTSDLSQYLNNEYIDVFSVKTKEEFPDDLEHRWIEITPTNAGNFPETGGTINVTGSYGLTGSLGTRKVIGYINDTITVEKNTTTSTKSGSKTYYYNDNPDTAPSATVTWTQDAHVEVFTYTYDLKIGTEQNNLSNDDVMIQFQADEINLQKHVYYSCVKNKVNESGDVVSSETFDTVWEYQESDNLEYSKFEANTLTFTQKKPNESYTENIVLKSTLYVTTHPEIKRDITVILLSQNSINLIGDIGVFYTDYNRKENKSYPDLQMFCRTTLPNPRELVGSLSTNFAPGVLSNSKIGYYNNAFMATNVDLIPDGSTNDQIPKIIIDFKKIRKTILDDKNVDVMKSFLEQDTPSFTLEFLQYWNTIGDCTDKILDNVYFNQKYYNETTNPSIKKDDKTDDFILTGYIEIPDKSKRLPVEQYAAFFGDYSINGHIQHATSIVKITYYLNKSLSSFTASIETNSGNVGKWNKGIRTKYCGKFKVNDSSCTITDDNNEITLNTTIKGISNDKYTFVTGDKFEVRYRLQYSDSNREQWKYTFAGPISGEYENFSYDSQSNTYTCKKVFNKKSLIDKIKNNKDFQDVSVVYLRCEATILQSYYYDKEIEIEQYYFNPKQVEFKLFTNVGT